jgi:transcriptional regulator of heat shock response
MTTLEMEARMHDLSDEQLGRIEERLAQTATRGEVTELRKEIKQSSAELRKEMVESSAELRKEIKESSAELRSEMVRGFAEIHSGFDRRLETLEERYYRLNYTLITGAIGVIITLIGFHG